MCTTIIIISTGMINKMGKYTIVMRDEEARTISTQMMNTIKVNTTVVRGIVQTILEFHGEVTLGIGI